MYINNYGIKGNIITKLGLLSYRRHGRSQDAQLVDPPDLHPATVTGLRVEEVEKGVFFDEDGTSIVLAGAHVSTFGARLKLCLVQKN